MTLTVPTTEDKQVYEESPGGKYDSPLAVALEQRWLDGDTGDIYYGEVEVAGLAVRYGRQVMVTDNYGFVSAYTFPDDDSADSFAQEFQPIEPTEMEAAE